MSRIDELIQELCPEGVPVRQLGEVAEVQRGRSISRSEVTDGPVPVLAGGQQPSCWHIEGNRTGENVVVAGSGAYAGFVSYWAGPIWVSDSFSIAGKPNLLLTKFCFYLLKNRQADLHQMKRGSGVPHVYAKDVANLFFPVPPIEVQSELVSILDKFTQLEAELEAELEARRIQYDHYRDSLLNTYVSDSGTARLDQLFDLRAGTFIAASDIELQPDDEHPIPCFGGGGLRGYVASPNRQGDLVLIGRQGALCGNVKRVTGEFYATEHSIVVTPREGVDIRWAFHLLKSMNLNQYASKSAQPGLAVSKVNQIVVIVPSPDEQIRVGSILDKLDALLNDITIGLPAEIAARRKQYEYYRNKLLTFKELEAA